MATKPHATGQGGSRPLLRDACLDQNLDRYHLGGFQQLVKCRIGRIKTQTQGVKNQKYGFVTRVIRAVAVSQACAQEAPLGVQDQTPRGSYAGWHTRKPL